jgi:tetraacyldisaccharide 4'-kinase
VRARLERLLSTCWWTPRRTPLSFALQPLATLYAALAWLRRVTQRARHPGVPVLVVGNLVVGGAGKTPTVIAIVLILRAFGWTPGVVSRGHGRRGDGVLEVLDDTPAEHAGDEPLLIRLRTRAPVMVGRDRVAAARALRQAHPEVDLIVSDDGLQHHRLARDVEVVVFDTRGVGNGALLPAGPLRERLPRETSPQRLVLYNANAPTTALPGWLAQRRLAGVVELADWWQGARADAEALADLAGRPVIALAGIATPVRFFDMLRDEGLDVIGRALPDHHDFARLPWREGTPDVVITEKDAVKLRPDRGFGATRVWVAPLDFQPELAFAAALRRHLPPPPSPTAAP